MVGGTLMEAILGITLQNIADMATERPDNLQRGADGTWSAADSTSRATLARRWGDWKQQGRLALVGGEHPPD
eukprot:8300041-Alexandrium_andersonii.AAC.1